MRLIGEGRLTLIDFLTFELSTERCLLFCRCDVNWLGLVPYSNQKAAVMHAYNVYE